MGDLQGAVRLLVKLAQNRADSGETRLLAAQALARLEQVNVSADLLLALVRDETVPETVRSEGAEHLGEAKICGRLNSPRPASSLRGTSGSRT